jgi:hypothetical protein
MLAGVVLEGAAMQLMEARLGSLIFEPYKKGRGNTLRRLAQGLTLAGASLSAIWGSKSRSVAMLAGGCVLAGTACERFSVFYAGFDSANDPKYVVIPQRARVDARERMSV